MKGNKLTNYSFSPQYYTLNEAIDNNFYIPSIELLDYPEEPIFEIFGKEPVSEIKEKMSKIMKYKKDMIEIEENNKNYYKQENELRTMFWADCFSETNINILPKKIKEAIIDMIIEKAQELNYMGNYKELRKLFEIFSKEMIQNFSQIGKNQELELTNDMRIDEEEE